MIARFLCAGWMWFALGTTCAMTYRVAPWVTHLVAGGLAGFVVGRFWENARPPQYEH